MFLLSYKHLKFDLYRIQINMLKYIKEKWLIFAYFFEQISKIVNIFSLELYII